MNFTSRFRLRKPAYTDPADIADANFNADIIDSGLVPYAGVTTGITNGYIISTPTITALVVGMAVAVKFNVDSTGASTLNWCSLGAKPIVKANGVAATNLKATGIYTLRYDGTNFVLQGEGASGTATASDLISGKTATTDAGEITGTIPLRGSEVYQGWRAGEVYYAPSTGRIHLRIPTGAYLEGNSAQGGQLGVYCDDPDYVPENFLATKNVFGMQGSIPVNPGTFVYSNHIATPQTVIGAFSGDGVLRAYMRPGVAGARQCIDGDIWFTTPAGDLSPENILNGKSILGINGNHVGKRYASGTVASNNTGTFYYLGGSGVSLPYVSVSGLSFTPSKIVLMHASGGPNGVSTVIYSYESAISQWTIQAWGLVDYQAVMHRLSISGSAYVNGTGFLLPCTNGGGASYSWIAYE